MSVGLVGHWALLVWLHRVSCPPLLVLLHAQCLKESHWCQGQQQYVVAVAAPEWLLVHRGFLEVLAVGFEGFCWDFAGYFGGFGLTQFSGLL